jgi:hypothetical protein
MSTYDTDSIAKKVTPPGKTKERDPKEPESLSVTSRTTRRTSQSAVVTQSLLLIPWEQSSLGYPTDHLEEDEEVGEF